MGHSDAVGFHWVAWAIVVLANFGVVEICDLGPRGRNGRKRGVSV